MSKFRIVGMDWFEVVVHVGVTFMAGVIVSSLFDGRGGDVGVSTVVGASLLLLGYRRKKALSLSGETAADAGRIEELESRLADLELQMGRLADLNSGQHRLAELEERLDFTERLLVQSREGAALPDRAR